MENLIAALALLLGTLLAIGISMAGLQLIMSFVPGPVADPRRDGEGEPAKAEPANS